MSDATTLELEATPSPLDRRFHEFVQLSQELRESYDRLLERAGRVERELARANERLREKIVELDQARSSLNAVLDAAPAGVIVADPAGRIQRANPAAERILGVAAQRLVGAALHDVRGAGGAAMLHGEEGEIEIAAADGRALVLHRACSAVRDAAGSTVGTVHLLEDRTESRRLEERLQQRETLAALGEMSATLAHEVRNPLHGIEGFASLLMRALPETPDSERPRGYARNIVRGVRELNAIVENLLEFARSRTVAIVERDLAAIARRAVDLAAVDRARVDVAAKGPTPARVDEVLVLQAIRNLVANALEASPEGGRVRVEVARCAGEAVVRVSDDGPGIPAELRARIFTPFFTTKSRGTGLGLAVVARAASAHGGRVELEPKERGSCFVLHLPQRSDR